MASCPSIQYFPISPLPYLSQLNLVALFANLAKAFQLGRWDGFAPTIYLLHPPPGSPLYGRGHAN